jgi:hypothetical protein
MHMETGTCLFIGFPVLLVAQDMGAHCNVYTGVIHPDPTGQKNECL